VIEAGGNLLVERLASVLQRDGRADETEHVVRYGLEPGARVARPWPASLTGR